MSDSNLNQFAEDLADLCNRYKVEPHSFAVVVLLCSVDVQLEKQRSMAEAQ